MTENDQIPNEPPEATEAFMAALLGISGRQLRRLVRDGRIARTDSGKYRPADVINKFIAYRITLMHRPRGYSDGLKLKQADAIRRRMEREREELIPMLEALGVFDEVTQSFLQAIDDVGAGIGGDRDERHRVAAILDGVKSNLGARFAEERHALETGKPEVSE